MTGRERGTASRRTNQEYHSFQNVGVHSLSLEREASTGVLAKFKQEFANI